jgi:hypothetical protein
MRTDWAIGAFSRCSGVLLVGMASVLGISQWAGANPDVVYAHEPIFQLSVRTFLWIMAGACAAVGLVCLLGQGGRQAAGLVAWLAANFEVYQAGLLWNGSPNLHGYLGEVSTAFALSLAQLNVTANIVWASLLLGSLTLLCYPRPKPRAEPTPR